MKTTRTKMKHNFLRKVIMRIDYQNMLDINDSIKAIQPILLDKGFVEMQEGFINDVEFQLNDPIAIENQNAIPIKEIKKTKTFKFRKQNKEMVFEINSLFCSLSIDVSNYKSYEAYGLMYLEIFNLILPINPFLKILRIGFRKINHCILTSYNSIANYFEPNLFPLIKSGFDQVGMDFEHSNSSYVDNLRKDKYMINYVRALTEGELNREGKKDIAYQIAIDIDGYNNDSNWLMELHKDSKKLDLAFREINDVLFEMYTNTLTKEFIKKLENDSFEDDIVIGVKKNEL